MSRPVEHQRPKGNGPRSALADKDDASARKQDAERADLLVRMRAKVQGEAPDWTPGTVGEDVMTVHKVRDGKTLCGAVGEVDEWQRAVTCPACLSAE